MQYNNIPITVKYILYDIVVKVPLLGIGHACSGCPQHFCDDDPAIIYGYCCGCAAMFGKKITNKFSNKTNNFS